LLRSAGGALLRELALGDKNVSELVENTGLSQPNVSNHLGRLRERGLVTNERRGRQIIYRLANSGLAHLILMHGEPSSGTPPDPEAIAAQFLHAVLTLREEEPARLVDSALAAGLAWRDLYLQVFVPALNRIGDMWEQNELSVADEHLITGIVLRLLHRLSLALPPSPLLQASSALVACVEGELHTIGGRMVADFLVARGWRVWYLNGFLPLEHLMAGVERHLPDAVVLCVSTEECHEHLVATVERIRRWRGEQPLPLIVAGGRYFATHPAIEGLDLCGTDIDAVTGEMDRRMATIRGRE
jgi:methanogenic corrinoid protein MtbC1